MTFQDLEGRGQRLTRLDAIPLALLALTALALGVAARGSSYDDAWITYRYAWNFAEGHGLVYNVGERYLGTSAPGYAALLGILGCVSPERIPAISGVLNALALTAIGLGLYVYGQTYRDRVTGFIAGLCFVANPIGIEAFGGEMIPQVALAVWAFVADARGRSRMAVLVAAAATMIRPDGLLLLAVIGVRQTWIRRQLPMREIALAGGVLAVWFGALWLYYGWPLPQTVGAKSAQRLSGMWRPFGGDLVAWYMTLTTYGSVYFGSRPAPGFTTLVYLVGLGVLRLWWTRHWWPLLAWPALYLIAYRQLHLPFYHWYAVPPLLAFAVSAGIGANGVAVVLAWLAERRRLAVRGESPASIETGDAPGSQGATSEHIGPYVNEEQRSEAAGSPTRVSQRVGVQEGCSVGRMPAEFHRGLLTATGYAYPVSAIAVALCTIAFIHVPLARYGWAVATLPRHPIIVAYEKAGRWLDVNTPPGSSVGYVEIGILGYYSHRTIVDPLGLVNPRVAAHVAIRDLTWAYRHYRPDYILHNPVFLPQELGLLLDEPWFRAEYAHVDTLESGRDAPLRIYKRVRSSP